MNPYEIHINDWVYGITTEGSEDQPEGLEVKYPVQVKVINGYCETITDHYGQEWGFSQLQPISLEDYETLKRFGFRETKRDRFTFYVLGNVEVYKSLRSTCARVWIDNDALIMDQGLVPAYPTEEEITERRKDVLNSKYGYHTYPLDSISELQMWYRVSFNKELNIELTEDKL